MKLENTELAPLANAIRGLAIDAVETAGHGHPGAAMGMADFATVLYANHLRFDARNPEWPDRDRVVLSNGHASILLYALLHLTGVPGVALDDLKAFRKAGSKTPGHPEVGHTPGVETTTGPLGQGIATAVGMAIAERRLRDEFGADLCRHRTWVFAGDGCLMEGVGQEAASLAGHLGLGHLNVLYDMNAITIDGSTDLSFTDDTAAKFKAMGWHVLEACGHTHDEIDDALTVAKRETDRPTIIMFRTTIGFGAPTKAGTSSIHGSKLGTEEAAGAKNALGLPPAPFDIPQEITDAWLAIGSRGAYERVDWVKRSERLPASELAEFNRRVEGRRPSSFPSTTDAEKVCWIDAPTSKSTRQASQMALEVLTDQLPELIGGSADLSGSNLTKTKATNTTFTAASSGRYINYGVREFAMAAAMNGLALHGGFVPYGGTFLVFSDYMRNAIRLSALMGTRVLYIMTHDSIGLGEDGPTHQPVEHLASLRAIPGLNVFRPADAIETMEAYEVALAGPSVPSLFAVSRQGLPQVRLQASSKNLTAKGGYVIRDINTRDITLIATGSEVSLAIAAAELLAKDGVSAAVVSMPCWELFDAQPQAYRDATLGEAPRLAIEAASPFGWGRYVGSEDNMIGVPTFGASASAEQLYAQFGLTPENIAATAKARLAAS
jgi:transketolase